MLFSIISSLVLVPVSSYLITDVEFASNITIPAEFTVFFDESVVGIESDLQPAVDAAIASHIYNGNRPSWTDEGHAFAAFRASEDTSAGNLTVEGYGYSAELDCRRIPEADYEISIHSNRLQVRTRDQECNVSHALNIPDQRPFKVIETWSEQDCNAENGFSRFGILAGANSTDNQTALANFSFISCIPSYLSTPGNLTVTFGLTPSPMVAQFSPQLSAASPLSFLLRDFYESNLQLLTGGLDVLTTLYADEIGRTIYAFAQHMNPTSPLSADTLMNATSSLYTSVFAAWTAAQLFRKVDSPEKTTAIKSVSTTRLIIIPPVAFTVIAIMSCMTALTILLFFYAGEESILFEEPNGLLSYAGILHGSEHIKELIDGLKKESGYDGRLIEAFKKRYGSDGTRYARRCYKERKLGEVIVLEQDVPGKMPEKSQCC
jgi:hypothetical protein